MPHDLNDWLVEEAKRDGRSVSNMINKVLNDIRNEKALSAVTLKALEMNNQSHI